MKNHGCGVFSYEKHSFLCCAECCCAAKHHSFGVLSYGKTMVFGVFSDEKPQFLCCAELNIEQLSYEKP